MDRSTSGNTGVPSASGGGSGWNDDRDDADDLEEEEARVDDAIDDIDVGRFRRTDGWRTKACSAPHRHGAQKGGWVRRARAPQARVITTTALITTMRPAAALAIVDVGGRCFGGRAPRLGRFARRPRPAAVAVALFVFDGDEPFQAASTTGRRQADERRALSTRQTPSRGGPGIDPPCTLDDSDDDVPRRVRKSESCANALAHLVKFRSSERAEHSVFQRARRPIHPIPLDHETCNTTSDNKSSI